MNKRTNAFVHTQGHINKNTHQIHQTPAKSGDGKREKQRGRETNRKTQRQMDKNLYLFVHFNVEAVRHLIVLRRTGSQMVRLVKTILNF